MARYSRIFLGLIWSLERILSQSGLGGLLSKKYPFWGFINFKLLLLAFLGGFLYKLLFSKDMIKRIKGYRIKGMERIYMRKYFLIILESYRENI